MEHYTVQQRIVIIRCNHQNSFSVRATSRVLRQIYGHHHRPTDGIIRRIVEKFETTGSVVVDQPTPVRRRNAHSDENIAAVRESERRSKSLNSSSCTRTWPFSDLNLASFA